MYRNNTNYRRFLWSLLTVSCALLVICMYQVIRRAVPDEINIREGWEEEIRFAVPMSAAIYEDSVLASGLGGMQEREGMDKISVDTTTAMVMKANRCNYYQMELRLFGVLPLKTVSLNVVKTQTIYPVGLPIGIYVKTEGVLVVDMSEFESFDGTIVNPCRNVLRKGDYILQINGETVTGKQDLIRRIRRSGGKDLICTLQRNGVETTVKCSPVLADDGEYKLGIWIRDSAQGIGTLTYIDQRGGFGALGHGINDVDTDELMDLRYGGIYRTDIIGIERGKSGHPGELTGVISFEDAYQLGDVRRNTKGGIFGSIQSSRRHISQMTGITVGLKQEIRIGDAQILCKVGEKSGLYDVRITRL
ncbi:MAG: SpoIVB peptidase, partial [Lachnospiraceae bacterium]|nr:SpoIVB peptidase [Lachnospiraceae bacterium]